MEFLVVELSATLAVLLSYVVIVVLHRRHGGTVAASVPFTPRSVRSGRPSRFEPNSRAG